MPQDTTSKIDELDEAQGSDEAVEALFGRRGAAEMLGTDHVIQIAAADGFPLALTAQGNIWRCVFPPDGGVKWIEIEPPPGCEGGAR